MIRLLLAALLAVAPGAQAAVPSRLNYQGKLANTAGDPVSGTYSFRAQSVVNGIYSVQVGS